VKLVEDWRAAWKWFSVQGLALLAAAPVLYENFPTLQGYLPANWFHAGMGILAVLAILGRVVKQG
jgi:cytochrome b561